MTASLGRLEPVAVRTVWTHEANEFTPWLATPENLALLAETLQLGELSDPRTEVPVGSFSIDILAKDDEGGTVVIENQLEPTDHTRLGQIMTYLAGQEGRVTVVWIAQTFREEHRAAIDWLNASTISGFDFFAVEVEVWKIGDSTPALRFSVVGKPNTWSRSVTRATRSGDAEAVDERQRNYLAYWSDFGAFLKERKASFTVADPPPKDYECGLGIWRPGVWLFARAGMRDDRLGVGLQLFNRNTSKAFFDLLQKDRTDIDAEFGESLAWLRLDEQVRSKIEIVTSEFDLSNRDQWPAQHAWLLDRLLKFKAVFRNRIQILRLPESTQEPSAA